MRMKSQSASIALVVPYLTASPFTMPCANTKAEKTSAHALAVMTLCNKAGYPEMAEAFIRNEQGVEDVQCRLAECETIKSICAAARCTDKAAAYIQSGKVMNR